MTFVRRGSLALCFLLLVCVLRSHFARAQQPSAPHDDGPVSSSPQPSPPRRPTPCRPTSWPRPSPSAASATFSTLSAGSGESLFSGSCWPRAALPPLKPGRSAFSARRWLQGLLFFAVFLVLTSLANLPLDVFGHHVSRAYGISVQGWGSWLGDQGEGSRPDAPDRRARAAALQLDRPPLAAPLLVRRLARHPAPHGPFRRSSSRCIEPLFNHYEPLAKHHPALVAELERVVARTGTNIPPDRMFLMKASEKSNGLNAYVSGLGATKRIVVWDTTAGRIPDDEIMFIFGHESGHYVLNHIPKMLSGFAIALFFVYWACAGFAAWLARRFGVRWGLFRPEMFAEPQPLLATRAGFVVLLFAISVAGFILEPAANTFSRHFEHEADVYGQEAIHGLVPDPQKTAVAGFNALGEAWLEDPNPSPFIEFWEYNHPSVKTRANFAAQLQSLGQRLAMASSSTSREQEGKMGAENRARDAKREEGTSLDSGNRETTLPPLPPSRRMS